MIDIRVYDKLTAHANAWVHWVHNKCDRATTQELQAHLAEGHALIAAVRADCAKLKSEKARLEQLLAERSEDPKILEVQAMKKERDLEIHNCQLLAGYVRDRGGFSIDDLVREIPKLHLAEVEKQKGRQLPEFARTRIKSEVANGLRATLTQRIHGPIR